jgi:serine/threonine protein kinase
LLVWRRKKSAHGSPEESTVDPKVFDSLPPTAPPVPPPTYSMLPPPPGAPFSSSAPLEPSPFVQSLATSASLSRDPLLSSIASSLRSGRLTPASRASSGGAGDLQVIRIDDVSVHRLIGGGSFGRVYEGTWRHVPVAIKMLVDSHGVDVARASASASASAVAPGAAPPDTLAPALQREAALMAALRHPNVVQIFGVCTHPPALVQEYCQRGSVTDVYRRASADATAAAALSWNRRLNMLADAAKGLTYLHTREPPMLHRDLKSPNLLVDEHWRVKVADLGLSKLVADHSKLSMTSAGGASNPRWLASDIFADAPATAASDVYAFGVVMHELLTWRLPWEAEGINEYGIVSAVAGGRTMRVPPAAELPGPPPPQGALAPYEALMRRCWAREPSVRPTMGEVANDLAAQLARCP